MKTILIILATTFITPAFAVDFYDKAYEHLSANGYAKGEIVLEQETDQNLFYLEEFAIEHEVAPCHMGVIIDKASGGIHLGKNDSQLNFNIPYMDVHVHQDKTLIEFCLD